MWHALVLVIAASAVLVTAELDFYEVLELPEKEDSTEKDIKSNFRRLSKQYHPDLHGESTREKYQLVQRANEVLSDRRKRKVYDIKGEEGLKQYEASERGGGNGGMPDDPFLRMFFGGGGGQGGGGANKGANNNMLLVVNLEDLYNGASHTLKLNKQRICKKCRGTGADSKEDFQVCSTCKGTGHTIQRIQIMPGFVQQAQAPCTACGGKGKTVKKKCTQCKGKKVARVDQTLGIEIEPGSPENFELVYDMEADQNPDQIPGDVTFTLSSAPHRLFTRKGKDLEMTMPLNLREALLGFSRTFRHMDDREVEVDEDGVVQFGQKRVLKGEGMPVHHVPSEKGDLTLTYEVNFTVSLTSEQQRDIAQIL